jgi:catechol 2,3-dioxygenase-like lactoylglutathione lyase family enzyme
MLGRSDVATRLPAGDLARARAFYRDKLGLEPVEERPGGLKYRCGGGTFALFTSAGGPSGTHTQMGWEWTTWTRPSRRFGRGAWSSSSTICPGSRR